MTVEFQDEPNGRNSSLQSDNKPHNYGFLGNNDLKRALA